MAIKQFGPMVPTVFAHWGLERTADFGEMVWQMIDLGVFGKTDSDSRSDFNNVFDFSTAFVEPYLPIVPAKPVVAKADPEATSKPAAA